jgi:flagellar motility protein MotE (MotC chaperone)
MEEMVAASILAKLNARAAGAILNEMDAAKAARLTDAMAGKSSPTGKKS